MNSITDGRRQEISPIDKEERRREFLPSRQVQAGPRFDRTYDARKAETLNMPSAAQQEPIQAITEAPSVWDRNEQTPFGPQNTPNLADRAGQLLEVFQSMVADHQVETSAGERQMVALRAGSRKVSILPQRRDIHIYPRNVERGKLGPQTTRSAPQVQNSLRGRKFLQPPLQHVHAAIDLLVRRRS